MMEESTDSRPECDIPLADEGESSVEDVGVAKPAEPLPREEEEEDQEEKARLIAQVLELQNTLDDLSQRVDSVKEESLKLRSENQVLGQYIENLMSASSVFQATTSPKHSTPNADADVGEDHQHDQHSSADPSPNQQHQQQQFSSTNASFFGRFWN